jgi:ABC-type multidrug transport system fused ATPase/permease subunit
MPGFRDPELCTSVAGTCTHSFGDRPIAYPQEIENFDTGGNGKLRAYASPGGYAKMIIIAVFFALTAPGAALASAYLPGYKFALVAIAFFTLLASIAPLIVYFTQPHIDDEEDLQECFSNIVSPESCIELYTTDNLNADFLNCVGAQINSLQGLCIPAYTALLPQFGVFQTLAMVLSAEITFDTVPPSSYVEDVLIPSIDSDCSGDSCKFPYASTLYWANIGFLFVSAVLLLILGVLLSYVFAFPAGWVLHMKHRLDLIWAKVLCRGESADLTGGTGVEQVELEEVRDEREIVQGLVRPLLDHPELELSAVDHSELSGIEEPHPVTHIEQNPTVADHSMIPREDLPPILAHRLRKVYPSIGGIPPKVALKSLDLHVPKGQVLGLLGKNGAGEYQIKKL